MGTHSAILSVPLLLGWLAIFWRMAASAGLGGLGKNSLIELIWVISAAALLILANQLFGPEIAAMAALGPLIVLQFWIDERPDRARWISTLRVGLPYAALIAGLAASRGVPALTDWLRDTAALRPFAGAPTWFPLLHPGSWAACGWPDHSNRDGPYAGRPLRSADDVVPWQKSGPDHLDLSDHRRDPG
jgi:lactate permease